MDSIKEYKMSLLATDACKSCECCKENYWVDELVQDPYSFFYYCQRCKDSGDLFEELRECEYTSEEINNVLKLFK